MSDMTPSEETAYGIIGMLGNDSRFKSRMDELIAARKAAEDAAVKLTDQIGELSKKKVETDTYVNGRKAELEAKRKEHDAAAKEAADRLKLAQDQAAEALRIAGNNERTAKSLADKEANIAAREKLMKDQQEGMAARLHEIEVGQDLVRRQAAHMAAMPKQ